MNLEEYPKELIAKRNEIEGNFIMSLYKEPELIDDFSNIVNGEDILTDDGCFYYGLAQNMYKMGYKVFDNVSINTYLKDKKVLRDGFERRGGFRTIQDITSIIDTENIEANYDELIKNNLLLKLYSAGFPVLKYLSKFSEMTCENVYDFYDYKLASIMSDKVEKNKVIDISKNNIQFINDWNQGSLVGFQVGLPMLNKRLLGIHKKNMLLHLSHSGRGKTTTAIILYILPALKRGEDVLVIANEQGEAEWRNMLIAAVLFNEIGFFKMNRSGINEGNYEKEEYENLKRASEWLEAEEHGKVLFQDLDDYGIRRIKKTIKKYAKLGCGLVILDTLKPEQENSDKAWAEFNETAKKAFTIAKKEDIGLIATAQLTPESMSNYYLDLNNIGKAKGISETANQVVMFRFLFNDEKERLKPYTFKKSDDGKYTNIRELHDLDVNKTYIVFFTPKNRSGETTTQIVAEWNPNFLTMKQVGWVSISPNGFKNRS